MKAFEELEKVLENQLREIEANEVLQICNNFVCKLDMGVDGMMKMAD